MSTGSTGYLSIIGFSLIEPLLILVETLEATEPKEPNEVQTGRQENGYSAAIVVLSVLLLESAINRVRYFEGKEGRIPTAAGYFATISPDPELAKAVDEVFAVRDAIVHNHVWEAQISWPRGQGMKFVAPPKLREGYGNKRFKQVIDLESRLSRHLKLNLFPSRIWRRDAYTVLKIVKQALILLDSVDSGRHTLSYEYFEFQGREVTFYEVITELCNDQTPDEE